MRLLRRGGAARFFEDGWVRPGFAGRPGVRATRRRAASVPEGALSAGVWRASLGAAPMECSFSGVGPFQPALSEPQGGRGRLPPGPDAPARAPPWPDIRALVPHPGRPLAHEPSARGGSEVALAALTPADFSHYFVPFLFDHPPGRAPSVRQLSPDFSEGFSWRDGPNTEKKAVREIGAECRLTSCPLGPIPAPDPAHPPHRRGLSCPDLGRPRPERPASGCGRPSNRRGGCPFA